MQEPYHEQVYEFVSEHRKPFVTSSDVSEQFPQVSARTVRERLSDLVDDGRLKVREVGGASKVWYLPEAES